jgi:membrane protein implicated in regulation of membrane protease activity
MTAYWLLGALAAFVIEVLSPFFGFSLVGVAAVAAAAVAAFGRGLPSQFAAFGVCSFFLLGFLRSRIALKIAASAPGVPTRAEGLIGKRAKVVEAIDPQNGRGRVLVDGVDWSANCAAAVPEGADVLIEGHRGIRLLVSPVQTQR